METIWFKSMGGSQRLEASNDLWFVAYAKHTSEKSMFAIAQIEQSPASSIRHGT